MFMARALMTEILNKFARITNLRLNLGCGRNVKTGWVNVDFAERENKLDIVCDLSKEFPFDDSSCSYIYSEHLIEHLEWLDGRTLIEKCFKSLQEGGMFRIVFPDFEKIFKAYINKDDGFLNNMSRGLDDEDYGYYKRVYYDSEQIRKERAHNPPPDWHLSHNEEDRKKVALRIRQHKYLIDIVDWAVHQFGEHKTLYDAESMIGLLKEIGFSKVFRSSFDPEIDSGKYYIPSCCYIEAIK
jgi:predicted SAM-dependent methyltransferase